MGPIADRQGWEISAARCVQARRRLTQKPRPASGLHAGSGGETPFERQRPANQDIENPHHSGTRGAVPFRYSTEAPRLNAAFVAQLLGQVMPNPEQGKLQARAAYGADQSRATGLLDTLL